MKQLINKYWRLVQGAADRGFRELMGPGEPPCTCCRSMPQYVGFNPLSVCRSCMDRIPWITHIECPVCGRYESCPDCSRRGPSWLRRNRSAVRYDEEMKELLARYKYRGDQQLKELLGRMLLHAYRSYGPGADFNCITYVPLSKERMEERGFNQAEQMARVLGEKLRRPVIPMLVRIKHTDKQSQVSRYHRQVNLGNAFVTEQGNVQRLLQHYGRRSFRILIVDDVYTTGTTLNHCAAAIMEQAPHAKVYGLCWAR